MMPPNAPPPDPEPSNAVAEVWSRPRRVKVKRSSIGWSVVIEKGLPRYVDTVSVRGDFWTVPDSKVWECEAQKVEILEVEGRRICSIFCVPPQDQPQS